MNTKRMFVAITLVSLMAVLLMFSGSNASLVHTGKAATTDTEYPWLTESHNYYGTSTTPSPGPTTNHVLWRFNIGSGVGSPAINDGICYVGSETGEVWALDAATGETIFMVDAPSGFFAGQATGIAKIRDNYGIQPAYDLLYRFVWGRLACYEALSGTELWVYSDPGLSGDLFIYNPPASVYIAQPIIITGGNNRTWATNWDGSPLWKTPVGCCCKYGALYEGPEGPTYMGPMYVHAGSMQMGYGSRRANPYRPEYLGWEDPANWPEIYYPGYSAAYDVSMYYNLTTRRYEWLTESGGPEVQWEYPSEIEGCNWPLFSPEFGNTIYGGCLWTLGTTMDPPIAFWEKPPPGTALPGHLLCQDAWTGALKWKCEFDKTFAGAVNSNPSGHYAVAFGYCYSGSFSGDLYCIDEATGDGVWWRENVAANTYNGPVVSAHPDSELVYYGGSGWRMFGVPAQIYAFDAHTGETVWQYAVPDAPKRQAAIADGRYYVGSHPDFYCFGTGPSETTLDLSSKQLKAGETVLISGQVRDTSPSVAQGLEPEFVANAPVMLMAVPLGGTDIINIGTLTTSASGDYYTEWVVPDDLLGKYSIVASFLPADERVEASSATTNFYVGAAEEVLDTEELVQQVTEAIPPPPAYTTIDLVIIAAVVVTLVIVIYGNFIRKKD